jgi:hypothetical protein
MDVATMRRASETPSAEADTPEVAPAAIERQPDVLPSGPDRNCVDIGRMAWVGSNDYHELDRDRDG